MCAERPPHRRATTLERAYELARSGDCSGAGEIRKRLMAERYDDVRAQFESEALKADLRRLCIASGGMRPRPLPASRKAGKKGADEV